MEPTRRLHSFTSLKADDYARLRGFDGRSRLRTYLSLVARDVLADELAGQFSKMPHEAWERFSRYFETDIRSRIGRQLPSKLGRAGREDAYQEVCLKLIENDFRRIRSYGGRGSFTGYILTVVDRILIDLVRRSAGSQSTASGRWSEPTATTWTCSANSTPRR